MNQQVDRGDGLTKRTQEILWQKILMRALVVVLVLFVALYALWSGR
jgi:hypothetical protein